MENKWKYFIYGILMISLGYNFLNWQNNELTKTRYVYYNDKLGDEFDDYKIIQVSDLHNKSFGDKQEKIIKMIKDGSPNIIVVTGDMFDGEKLNKNTLDFFEKAIKVAPIYYVDGNHERALPLYVQNEIRYALNKIEVICLDNEYVVINKNNVFAYLIGLKDKNLKDATLNNLMKNMEDENLKILLAHELHLLNVYTKENIDLVFSGHAHGGQWRILTIGGVYAPNQGLMPKLTSGMIKKNNTTMIINRGLGNMTMIPRLNNRPEIVEVTLKTKS